MRFVDTNIFIRYLTGDDERKAQACYELFQRVKAGEERVTTCEAVLTEVVHVGLCVVRGWGLGSNRTETCVRGPRSLRKASRSAGVGTERAPATQGSQARQESPGAAHGV